jgi:hypothetical protein
MSRKLLFLFSCIFLAYAVVSCNGNKSTTSENADTAKAVAALAASRANITEDLHVLYLNNRELKKLLDDSPSDKRIVFQFFHDKSGGLILHAWSREGQKFDKGKSIGLHYTNLSYASIAGKDVHLGNLHVGRDGCDSLVSLITMPYIVFCPEITRGHTPQVIYNIYGCSSLQSSCCDATKAVGKVITANPSPPRPAD